MSCAAASSIYKTYYEILSVKEGACYDEIKAGYRLAVLKSHPDKLNDRDGKLNVGFLAVQKAWEVLSNPHSRAVYDQELNTLRLESVLAREVSLDEMTIEKSGGSMNLVYPCRCGDFFSIDSDELEEMGFCLDEKQGLQCPKGSILECMSVVIPCFSCSLKIHVMPGCTSS